MAAFHSGDIWTRRICTEALLRADNPSYSLAYDRLRAERDPFLRGAIFRHLMSVGHDLDAVKERFLLDKFYLNRLLALQYTADKDRQEALKLSERLLLDRSAICRAEARHYLDQYDQQRDWDYREFYLEQVMGHETGNATGHETGCLVAAIYGLGETGNARDAVQIEQYLDGTSSAVVRATMTALMHLDEQRYAPVITALLLDERPGVVKTARNLLKKTLLPDYARVLAIFHATPYLNTKQKCFSLLLTASLWQRLIFIFEVLEATDGDMREGEMRRSVLAYMRRWLEAGYRRYYIRPSQVEIEQIMAALARNDAVVPDDVKRRLLSLIRGTYSV
jgi:hypothetical protein